MINVKFWIDKNINKDHIQNIGSAEPSGPTTTVFVS
jgi:hypothetical protein